MEFRLYDEGTFYAITLLYMLKGSIKKIGVYLSLFFFLFSLSESIIVSAVSLDGGVRKEVILSKKHSGKELNALRKALRSENEYRLVIESDQSQEQIQ